MDRLGFFIRWRMLFATLVVALGVVVGGALLAPASEAAGSANCAYYNDAAHTTLVGQYGRDCCNNSVAWGQKTAFKVCGGCFICFPPPP